MSTNRWDPPVNPYLYSDSVFCTNKCCIEQCILSSKLGAKPIINQK